MPADPIVFFERPYPSANTVLVRGENPILMDTGYGSDLRETEELLRRSGSPPETLSLVVNSHYHCDHAGGNSGLQWAYGIPVAAHRWEAELVNRRDREACGVEWLDQPIEPYRVDRPLSDGDELDAGPVVLQVIETPGHTLGHISLYATEEETLLLGDAVHGDDVAWLNPFREGVGATQRALESLDRLSTLRVRQAFSGHGAEIPDLAAAIDGGRRRYEKWLEEPEKAYWHACKRIFGYALMIYGGLDAEEVSPYLLRCPWFGDYARHGFGTEPEAFVEPLVAEMLRSKAAGWRDGRLAALPPHIRPSPGWPSGPMRPSGWPRLSPQR